MSAMRDMSRAIRHELQEWGPTLQSLPDEELREFTEILGAFFYDLVGEQDRRGWGSARPAATVARVIRERGEAIDRVLAYCDSCDQNGGLPSTSTLRSLLEVEHGDSGAGSVWDVRA